MVWSFSFEPVVWSPPFCRPFYAAIRVWFLLEGLSVQISGSESNKNSRPLPVIKITKGPRKIENGSHLNGSIRPFLMILQRRLKPQHLELFLYSFTSAKKVASASGLRFGSIEDFPLVSMPLEVDSGSIPSKSNKRSAFWMAWSYF